MPKGLLAVQNCQISCVIITLAKPQKHLFLGSFWKTLSQNVTNRKFNGFKNNCKELLESVTSITKWDSLLQSMAGMTKCDRRLSQRVIIITKWDVTV